MAINYQRRAFHRKLIYAGIIIALVTVSWFHRKMVIEPQAFNLRLRATTRGEVELTSSALRLTLLPSRGLATCFLWQLAIEKKKKHQWNELELVVRSITKLLTYFFSPLLFQIWNFYYNVSVECDRTTDKYFYITRGLQLLAEGERKHQGIHDLEDFAGTRTPFPGNPDMRFHIAMFYQMKIGNSDEKNAMRCMFDMSCIDPLERDPRNFYRTEGGRETVDLKAFRLFCEKYPRLVRRLRAKLRCSEPRDVIAFLERNYNVPSRFDHSALNDDQRDSTPLLDRTERFPVLPPVFQEDRDNYPTFTEDFSVFVAARHWHGYAQEPLPPPYKELRQNEPPYDRQKYRLPKMMSQIFRSFYPRAQSSVAEDLESEGWFDESGWTIRRWFVDMPSQESGEPVVVGRERKYHVGPAWQKAFTMYSSFGRKNGLLIGPEEREILEVLAEEHKKNFGPIELTEQQRRQVDDYARKCADAFSQLRWNLSYRRTTNFDEHYYTCKVERLPSVIRVKEMLFNAAELASRSANAEALQLYDKALHDWLQILLRHEEYRNVNEVLITTYEKELKYLRLLQDQEADTLKPLVIGLAQMGLVQPHHAQPGTNLPFFELTVDQKRRIIPIRKVRGFLEMVYWYKVPHREKLQNYILGVTEMAGHNPFGVSEVKRNWMLTLFTNRPRKNIPRQWEALLPDPIVSQVRSRLGLDRDRRETSQKQKNNAKPGG